MSHNFFIRPAVISDLDSIVDIYNQAIRTKTSTADTQEFSPTDKIDWLKSHLNDEYPIFLYEIAGKIAGWISISPYRKGRQALRFTVEISYYIDENFQRQGIGTKLIEFTIEKCRELKYKTLLAIVLEKNNASIKLLKKHNFEKWGFLPDVVDFDGKECGHLYYGLRIV